VIFVIRNIDLCQLITVNVLYIVKDDRSAIIFFVIKF